MSRRVRRPFRRRAGSLVAATALACLGGSPPTAVAQSAPPAPVESVTFDEAVQRAILHHPTVAEAAQAILRAQGLLGEARAVFRPLVVGLAGETILDAARGFSGNITQPKYQATFNATASYSVLDLERWAEAKQASDQVGIARISAEQVRRDVAVSASESFLAVTSARDLRDVAVRNRDTAKALADYARTRLEAGQGSRLNHIRATQELATAEGLVQAAELAVRRAQEALGVAIFVDGPVDASGEPDIPEATPPSDRDAWLDRRPDVRLFTAQAEAAQRVVRDTWKSWLPTASFAFTPQYVSPKGFFEPAKTWRALFFFQVPIYDATLSPNRRVRQAEYEGAALRLEAFKMSARSEVRTAQEAVARNVQVVASSREAAASAAEALRITEIAYRAGATTNIEVVQAQQTARNTDIAAALAEDRLRQARLDLLVSLGEFPR
jgi:outer membrane protein TolC